MTILSSTKTLAVTLSLCAVTAFAHAGAVVGKAEVGTTPLPTSVISVEGVSGGPGTGQHAVIDQRDKSFVPHVTAVVKGSTVELLNNDDFLHNTFSASPAKIFNLNQPGKGSRSLLRVDQPGIIDVRCHIHGQMHAWIIVLDNPYFSTSDARGLFRIENVPAGTYEVKCWSEEHGTLTQTIKVPKDGTTPVIFKYSK
jgi:plastocyanin